MNHHQQPYQSIGQSVLKVPVSCLFLVLGLLLICPYARSQTQPSLTSAEQRVLYEAQQAMTAKRYCDAQEMLFRYMSQKNDKVHYLVPFTLGNALALDGRNDDALTYYKKATEHFDADAALWLNMGKVFYDLRQFGRAGDCMYKAYTLMPEKKPELLYQIAVCFVHDKKPQQAMGYLEQICAPEAGEAESDWFEALIDVYLKLGKDRKAVALLRRLLGEKGDQPRWSRLLAHIHMKDHDYQNAAAAFKVYIDLADATREEVVRLGDLYRLAGIPLKAARQYEQALQWRASADDYERIAAAYLSAHRSDKAVETLTQALTKHPSARLWHMAGSIYYNREEYQKAYDAFKHCFQMGPDDGDAVLYMGYCALKMDKPHEAAKAFESAAGFSRQRAAAQKALTEIKRLAQRDTKH